MQADSFPQHLSDDRADPLYPAAVQAVLDNKRVSISMIQRILKLGYNRAARFVETMEGEGIVSAPDYKGDRKIIAALSTVVPV